MNHDVRQQQKEELKALGKALFHDLKAHESMTLTYSGEKSLFIRINQTKVCQASHIDQGFVSMDFISHNCHTETTFSITGQLTEDLKRAWEALGNCRNECKTLPEDPYIVLPEEGESSDENHYGKLAPEDKLADILLKPAEPCDLAGLYAAGILMRASMNSKGQFHWFSTENFYFDYSLYTSSQKAIKATYAGSEWDDEKYTASLQEAKRRLEILEQHPRKLTPGKYRVYLAPPAAAEFLNLLTWSGLSEQSLRQGQSPLKKLSEGEMKLSPLFSLDEDFHLGLIPRFNEFGEISPLKISLIKEGELASLLVNKRTAQEYSLTSNAANISETPRSVKVQPGNLKESSILSRLGTGVYISNLHYLNWSDLQNGRATGMTRYGCFWVEEGKIVSPIQDMRFDETLYNVFGDCLEDLGEKAELIPHIFSYGEQSLGGTSVPGMLLNNFTFTL
ncbi:MAG: TldD/PmbA family protein [Proteobacteria bacterium]|nr:TldD/PmbA family protein [Pseudomonadota bacterium]